MTEDTILSTGGEGKERFKNSLCVSVLLFTLFKNQARPAWRRLECAQCRPHSLAALVSSQVLEPFIPKLTPLHMIRIFISSQKKKSTHLMTIHTVHTCHTHTSCNVGSILDTFDICSLFFREEWIWYTGPFITPTHTQVSERTPALVSFSP